jgi:Uma2 family endonuclease
MMQVITFPEPMSGITIRQSERARYSDDDYWAFCEANPDLHVERTAEGEIVVVPPAGGESDYRNLEVAAELRDWARKEGSGKTFGPSVQYFLPDGSGLSPDASWVSNESLATLSKQERKKFLRLSPEFVVEVLSPSDDLGDAKAKMQQWIANGVQLGWLIDGDARTVYVYRKGKQMRSRRGITELAGEGPIQGFVLDLKSIWQGL